MVCDVATIASAGTGLACKRNTRNRAPTDSSRSRSMKASDLGWALREAEAAGIAGKGITPFLLSKMAEMSGGMTLDANIALLKNNARVAAEIAAAVAATTRAQCCCIFAESFRDASSLLRPGVTPGTWLRSPSSWHRLVESLCVRMKRKITPSFRYRSRLTSSKITMHRAARRPSGRPEAVICILRQFRATSSSRSPKSSNAVV